MKDAVGNELKVGDLVLLQLERPVVFGRIIEAQDGGLMVGSRDGSLGVAAGHLMIMSQHPVAFDPQQPIRAVVALRDESPEVQKLRDHQGDAPVSGLAN